MEIKLSKITCELDFVYYYKGKKFFTESEAIKYKDELNFQKNEEELIAECQDRLKTPLAIGFAHKDNK